MKISKLFHWLYAILMLLPAFFVGGRMAYTIFNKNAYQSYSGEFEITNKYETNEVTLISDLVIGNIYNLTFNEQATNNTVGLLQASAIYNFDFYQGHYTAESEGNNYLLNVRYGSGGIYIQNEEYQGILNTNWSNLQLPFTFQFVFYRNLNIDLTSTVYTISESSYLPKNEVTDTSGTLDNAFDYSMSQLNELPLFSWAKDSFIVQPFTYITGLFGMPSDSPVLTLLSYWCSISLIWLTFDLLMYVPLLVHRWLDKGVLE